MAELAGLCLGDGPIEPHDKRIGRNDNVLINISLAQAKRILGYAPQYKLVRGFKDYREVSTRHSFWS